MVILRHTLLSLLAALALAASYHPISLWIAAPIGYGIYLWLLKKGSHPIIYSLIFGCMSAAIVLSWSKTFVGALPWLLLALLQALYFIPVAVVARYLSSLPAVIAMIILMEEVKSRFPFGGFGWMRIGFSQADSLFAPYFSLIGVAGVSLLTLTSAYLVIERNRLSLSFLALILLSSLFLHFNPAQSEDGKDSDFRDSLNIRLVQGGVPVRGLDFNSRAEQVLDNHIKTTVDTFDPIDQLIIWPENAIDIDPIRSVTARIKIRNLQNATKTPLLAGAILDGEDLFNAGILFDERGEADSIYRKQYLTPFGEFIPLRTIAEFLSPHAKRVTDFSAGDSMVFHQANEVSISSVICYELLNDSILRSAAEGSSMMAIMTNSATFSGSAEGDQQMSISRIRAMESGRYLASVSTTGPSAFISPKGEILKSLSDGEVGSIAARIPSLRYETFYLRYGQYFTIAITVISILLIVGIATNRVVPRRRNR